MHRQCGKNAGCQVAEKGSGNGVARFLDADRAVIDRYRVKGRFGGTGHHRSDAAREAVRSAVVVDLREHGGGTAAGKRFDERERHDLRR